jgi:hypothetical protein
MAVGYGWTAAETERSAHESSIAGVKSPFPSIGVIAVYANRGRCGVYLEDAYDLLEGCLECRSYCVIPSAAGICASQSKSHDDSRRVPQSIGADWGEGCRTAVVDYRNALPLVI